MQILKAISQSLDEDGLTPHMHDNTKRLLKHTLSLGKVRAVPEIILGGGTFFFQTTPPPGHTWSQSPLTPRTRKCFN